MATADKIDWAAQTMEAYWRALIQQRLEMEAHALAPETEQLVHDCDVAMRTAIRTLCGEDMIAAAHLAALRCPTAYEFARQLHGAGVAALGVAR